MVVDTHCHVISKEYNNIEEIIWEMKDHLMIISGCDDISNQEVVELVKKYPHVYGTIGIHPSEIDTVSSTSLEFLENHLRDPKIVGLGEIGLDYHYDPSNAKRQRKLFELQLQLAQRYDKTVVIHSRDAIEDTYNLLKKYTLKSVIHCFSSSYEMAQKFIKLGSKIGIGGVITFKNSSKLKEVVEKIDLENFLLETDSPYLTPEPYRGQKNKPIYTLLVASKIAEIKGIPVEKVMNITTNTAIDQFDLPF